MNLWLQAKNGEIFLGDTLPDLFNILRPGYLQRPEGFERFRLRFAYATKAADREQREALAYAIAYENLDPDSIPEDVLDALFGPPSKKMAPYLFQAVPMILVRPSSLPVTPNMIAVDPTTEESLLRSLMIIGDIKSVGDLNPA